MFAPDGKTILTASADGATRRFMVSTAKLLSETIQFTDGYAVFSAPGKLVLAAPVAWKYLHVVEEKPDGSREIRIPDLVPMDE